MEWAETLATMVLSAMLGILTVDLIGLLLKNRRQRQTLRRNRSPPNPP